MRKSLSTISILAFILIYFSSVSFSQLSIPVYDSLFSLTKSKTDTIRLEAYKRLTWESRFSDPLQGFEFAFDGLALAENLNRGKDMATLHNYIGVLATKINSYDKAKVHILKALRISNKLNIPTEKAYALNNLGEIYYHTGKLDSAIFPMEEAIGLFKKINDLNGLAYAYNQMGMAQRNLKKYDEAFNYHKLSLEIRIKLNHKEFVTKAYLNIGIDLLEKGDYAEARSYFEKMDQQQLDKRPYFSVPYQTILIGKTFGAENNLNMAIQYFKDAYKQAQKDALFPEMRDASKLLSDIYDKQKNHKTALYYFNLFKIYDDSVKNTNLVAEYKELELKKSFDQKYRYLEYKMQQDIDTQKLKLYWNRVLIYSFLGFFAILMVFIILLIRNFRIIAKKNSLLEVQKADIESKNDELNTQNQQISEQNQAISKQRDELAMANATKDKFFSIIAHDLRGPVGNLTAFFNLIIDSYQDKIDPKLMDFFFVVNSSVQQTYTLLENLLTWAQIQNGTIPFNPQPYNLFTIVDNNINLVLAKASDKKLNIRNLLPAELISEFDTYMVDAVIRNLLSNAIKFTNDGGTIVISGSKKSNLIEIAISDTGIGMSQKNQEHLFRIDVKHKTKEGTNGEKGSGLGLILCKEFIEKHGGKVSIESEIGKGTKFIFTLPYSGKDKS